MLRYIQKLNTYFGLWQAQARAKEIGESKEKITLAAILRIHKVFFEDVNPGIAGRFRRSGEDIKKLKYIEPPQGTAVQTKMYEFWRELDTRLSQIPNDPKGSGKAYRKALENRNNAVVDLAAWTQHNMAAIHPFCEGNGRMARMMTNLILYRFKLQPTDIKYEGENKVAYLDALGAIDRHGDYRPLAYRQPKRLHSITEKNEIFHERHRSKMEKAVTEVCMQWY
jgi:fido (protein-threonine AMPylation protein)